ncbi:MAG TPA: GMC family oxidoreductase [Bryobacteraceae bacterium]|nr:GMC family oxidoreductase [Bryobacteraceae bacterium]
MPEMYDVVIVGSGAGGGMAAYMLTQAGAKVAVVEAGGHNIDRDLRHHQWPWEMRYRNVYQQDPVQVNLVTKRHIGARGDVDEVITFDGSAHRNYYNDHFFVKMRDWRYTWPEGSPYRWVRVRSIGGKTNCWDAGALRWGPVEWKPYSYDGYGIDWPISYDEMAPWYSKTERLIGVSGDKIDRITATPSGEYMKPQGMTCAHAIMRGFAVRQGYLPVHEPYAIITQDHNGRPKCHNCGRCGQGCDVGAKFTSVSALLPVARATGRLTMISNAIVREVLVDGQGLASGVSYVDRYTFKDNVVRGRYVVLSASAIETSRILLNSKSNLFPNGLANSSGQVGRNLVEDMAGSVSGELPQLEGRPVTNEDGYQGTMLIHPFANVDEKSRSKDFMRRYVLRFTGHFAMGGGPAADALFGPDVKSSARRLYGGGVSVTGAGGGLENPNNYMDVDPDVKDAWGIPAARIHLKHGPNQEAMIRDIARRGVELIEAAGGKVNSYSSAPSVPGANIHEQGTCRMGDDPKKFVTNRWGQTHDVRNLILADGSIHCTSGITNPTLTILTMTMRNMDHLAEEVRKGS